MADISLTASMRSNLLSLQQTQDLMDMTQERLRLLPVCGWNTATTKTIRFTLSFRL